MPQIGFLAEVAEKTQRSQRPSSGSVLAFACIGCPLERFRKPTPPVLEAGLAGAVSLSPRCAGHICLSESPSELCGLRGLASDKAEAESAARTASGASSGWL